MDRLIEQCGLEPVLQQLPVGDAHIVREGLRDLLASLRGMVEQHCLIKDGVIDSMCLSANAEAMETLERFGVIRITRATGRAVTAVFCETTAVFCETTAVVRETKRGDAG